MHTIEEKHQFTLLRVQGWSIAKISAHMKIPRATIWRWDHDEREILPMLKAARFEELQEKYVPTYEEELEQLAAYRNRIRKALGDQDFSTMKPEFLLQMDLQISARLAKFRANLALHSVPEDKPVSLPGCLSHADAPYHGVEPYDDPAVEGEPGRKQSSAANPPAPVNASPVNAAPAHPAPVDPGHPTSNIGHSSSSRNGTFRDKTPPGSKRDDSAPTTSDEKNGTVPFYKLLEGVVKELTSIANSGSPASKGKPAPKKRNSTSKPARKPSNTGHSSPCKNGTFRDKTPPGSKRAASASTTSNEKNGTVPFSKNGKPTKSPPVQAPAATPQPATSNGAHEASHSANGSMEDPKPKELQPVASGHSSFAHSASSSIEHPGSSIDHPESSIQDPASTATDH